MISCKSGFYAAEFCYHRFKYTIELKPPKFKPLKQLFRCFPANFLTIYSRLNTNSSVLFMQLILPSPHMRNYNKLSPFFFATSRVVFSYRVLPGIAIYTEQNLAMRSKLYRVEYFCYSEQVMRSRIFLLFRVGSRLYREEHFYYSEQVLQGKIFLLFRLGYTEQNISAIPSR